MHVVGHLAKGLESSAMNTLNPFSGSAFDALPQPFTSLTQLLQAEEADAHRVRLSRLGWWVDVRRIRGSTLSRTWRATAIITLWATFIAVAEFNYGKQLNLTNNVTPLLSVVVGLLLVFRNGSAYARWDDGRKAFGNLTSIVRNLARSVWINVGAFPPATGRLASDNTFKQVPAPILTPEDRSAKVGALRLMVAFVVATKHHARGEYGVDYEDLRSLLPSKFTSLAKTDGFGYNTDLSEPRAAEFDRLMRAHSPTSSHESQPLASPHGERTALVRSRSSDSSIVVGSSKPSLPLPLIIAHQLSLYFALCKRKGLLETVGPAGLTAFQQTVNSLVDNFTTVERLSSVGIPAVYGIHLKQCVSLFLCTLPFTLVELMGWKMIPFVTICAFTLIGIEAIASEIEMPFGLDPSDLPLDLQCAELYNEVSHMIDRLDWHSESWLI